MKATDHAVAAATPDMADTTLPAIGNEEPSLQTLLFRFMCVCLVPLTALLILDTVNQGMAVVRTSRDQLSAVARVTAEHVAGEIQAYRQRASALATLLARSDGAPFSCDNDWLKSLTADLALDDVQIIDPPSGILCSNAPHLLDIPVGAGDLEAVARAGHTAIVVGSDLRLSVLVPTSSSGNRPRIVLATMDMQRLARELSATERSGSNADIYIASPDGQVLLSHLTTAGTAYRLLPDSLLHPAQNRARANEMCLLDEKCTFVARAAPVPGWFLLATVNAAPVVHSALWEALYRLPLTILALAAIVFSATRMRRRIERPLLRLTAAVHNVTAGNYDYRAQPSGVREVMQLGLAFNSMLDKLVFHELQRHRESVEAMSRFRDVAESSPVAIGVCDLSDGKLLYCNHLFSDLAGEGDAALIRRTPLEFVCRPSDRAWAMRVFLGNASCKHREIAVLRRDGSRDWLSVSVVRGDFGDNRAIFISCHDMTARKRAEALLSASEERFRLLLGALAEGVVLYDGEGCVQIANRSARELLGLEDAGATLVEMHGVEAFRTESGELLGRERLPVFRTLMTGRPERNRVIGLDRAGAGMCWLSVNTQPLFHAGAQMPYAVVASYSDLTTRIQVEQALRSSEQRHELVLEGINEGIAEWDSANDHIHFSARLAAIFGYPAEARPLHAGEWLSRIHPDDLQAYRDAIISHLKNESGCVQMELRIQCADQEYRWFRIRAIAQHSPGGRALRMVGSIGDISVRKRLQEIDTVEREILALIASDTPLSPILDMTGKAIERLVPGVRCVIEVGDQTSAIAWPDPSVQVRPVGQHTCRRVPVIATPGELLGNIAVYHADDWQPNDADERVLTKAVDIAKLAIERKMQEQEIRLLNASLEQRVRERTRELEIANRELEAFSYSVAHDLRSPLNAINGFSHILGETLGDTLDSTCRQLLGRIRGGVERMDRLIDDMLRYSRTSRTEMNFRETSLDALASSVAIELAERYPETPVNISPLFSVRGDTAMLRQVFVNLIGNALKFSSRHPSPRVDVGATVQDGQKVIYVRDNGVGFDLNYAPRLFGVFQRMHSATEFPGTGVGLALVKRIVERHGGRIWVDTAPDAGATFYFHLGTRTDDSDTIRQEPAIHSAEGP